MQIPEAGLIEQAVVEVKSLTDFERKDQLKELHAVGDGRVQEIGVTKIDSKDFQLGYLLGVQTARKMVEQSTALILAKVNPADVL